MIVNVSVCMTVTVNNPFITVTVNIPICMMVTVSIPVCMTVAMNIFVCMAVISSVSICMKRYLLSLCVQV